MTNQKTSEELVVLQERNYFGQNILKAIQRLRKKYTFYIPDHILEMLNSSSLVTNIKMVIRDYGDDCKEMFFYQKAKNKWIEIPEF